MREIEAPNEEEMAFARYAIELYRRHLRKECQQKRMDCPHCNPTAKAVRRVQDEWTVAGIDRD